MKCQYTQRVPFLFRKRFQSSDIASYVTLEQFFRRWNFFHRLRNRSFFSRPFNESFDFSKTVQTLFIKFSTVLQHTKVLRRAQCIKLVWLGSEKHSQITPKLTKKPRLLYCFNFPKICSDDSGEIF